MEEEVWNEFYGNPEYLAYESERLIAEFAKQSIEQSSNIAVEDLPQGVEHEMIVRHASTINPTASTAKEEQRDEDVNI
jgi:putative restriction endonuclease